MHAHVLRWRSSGDNVCVAGTFSNWVPLSMVKTDSEWSIFLKLKSWQVYQAKFVVDGEWKLANDMETVKDEWGIMNNMFMTNDGYAVENINDNGLHREEDKTVCEMLNVEEDSMKKDYKENQKR